MLRTALTAGAVATAALALPAAAQEVELPNTVVMTTYTEESAGFAQAVAIGGVFKDRYDTNIRAIPGGNDISRQAPLQSGQAQFSSTGFGVFYSQEAIFEFADREQWGPQPVRMVMINNSEGGIGLAVDPDLNINSPADLEGLRVAQIIGSPALNLLVESYLVFGGLSWDDVEVVEFGGFGAALDGYVADQVDAVIAVTDSGTSGKLMASPRNVGWTLFPHDDAESWARLQDFAPWFVPKTVTAGNNIPEDGLEFAVYHYPMMVTYSETEADLVYNMVKAMHESFDAYADAAPGAAGWSMDRQDLDYVMPYHEGAIRYYEEIGMWGEEQQANQDRLLERQAILQAAWAEVMALDIADDDAFLEAWQEARYAALDEAGFNPYFRTW